MAKIRQKTVVEQVMHQIKELIASGKYQPGDKIPTEHELAERFGIGRSSIREAIKIFNYLGILESKAAKGTFLSDRGNISAEALSWSILLGKDELAELIETRGAIELWSIIHLSSLGHNDQERLNGIVDELQNIVDTMKDCLEAGEAEKLIEADYSFHNIIVSNTGNKIFSSIYHTLKSYIYEDIEQSQSGKSDLNHLVEEHQDIIDTIRSGKTDRSIFSFNSHILNIESRLTGNDPDSQDS